MPSIKTIEYVKMVGTQRLGIQRLEGKQSYAMDFLKNFKTSLALYKN